MNVKRGLLRGELAGRERTKERMMGGEYVEVYYKYV
jgi:hypothetical protein